MVDVMFILVDFVCSVTFVVDCDVGGCSGMLLIMMMLMLLRLHLLLVLLFFLLLQLLMIWLDCSLFLQYLEYFITAANILTE